MGSWILYPHILDYERGGVNTNWSPILVPVALITPEGISIT